MPVFGSCHSGWEHCHLKLKEAGGTSFAQLSIATYVVTLLLRIVQSHKPILYITHVSIIRSPGVCEHCTTLLCIINFNFLHMNSEILRY